MMTRISAANPDMAASEILAARGDGKEDGCEREQGSSLEKIHRWVGGLRGLRGEMQTT
jgi:hypothetical protein